MFSIWKRRHFYQVKNIRRLFDVQTTYEYYFNNQNGTNDQQLLLDRTRVVDWRKSCLDVTP